MSKKKKRPAKAGKSPVASTKPVKNAKPVILPPQLQHHFNQALAHHKAGQLQEAANGYAQVLHHEPKHADSMHLLGLVFQAAGNLEQAREHIAGAIKLNPGVDAYHFNYGVVQQTAEQLVDAITAYRNVLRINPRHSQSWENLGVALQDTGDSPGAIKAFERALALSPHSVIALKNLGTLHFRYGNTRQSLDYFNRALEIDPANADLRLKQSGSLLRLGQLEEGWNAYNARFNAEDYRRFNPVFSMGVRHAEKSDLSNCVVAVHSEQGLGDEIMFASCIPDLIEMNARFILHCDPRLKSLYQRSFEGVEVVDSREGLAARVDCHLPIGELPRFYRDDDAAFPGTAYLFAEAERRASWRERLNQQSGRLKIGFSWRGGVEGRSAEARHIDFTHWRTLVSGCDATFVNLQYNTSDVERQQLNELGTNVVHYEDLDAFHDIENLAALVSELDLIISADNATVHLAGALGVPTWVLLPMGPERRWTDGRDRSLWYSSVRMLRQPGDSWSTVFAQMTTDLQRVQVGHPSPSVDREAVPDTPAKREESAGRRLLLINDTSDWYHWGCSGTSLALHHGFRERGYQVEGLPISQTANLIGLPPLAEVDQEQAFLRFRDTHPDICARIAAADVIVINGEGSLHGASATSLGLLYLAKIAKGRFGKPVHVVNHSVYPPAPEHSAALSSLYASVYGELDTIAIREPQSLAALQVLGCSGEQSFDCLPLFIDSVRHELAPAGDADGAAKACRRIVIAGSVVWQQSLGEGFFTEVTNWIQQGRTVELLLGASAYQAGDDVLFARMLVNRCPGVRVKIAQSELEWLAAINDADALVSGRFHHTIAAACLKTPVIVFASNTPKVLGLVEALSLHNALVPSDADARTTLSAALLKLEADPSLFVIDDDTHWRVLSLAQKNFDIFR
ncbi:tetratricopeptide repeat protein [Spongiibacter sp. KMU-166]|uniref:Tetratricopeptide repeat protein n=1 Tax=Spongiibacter thalassae TaxID=2721624 RepID=A0ABX1GDV9_9GAMM|nr:tetratricopeptide repeat protein [Spongiibacter thalassae]NKI16763.1 tetratricopeptide repeat protein [Spongiibacter thalassae]